MKKKKFKILLVGNEEEINRIRILGDPHIVFLRLCEAMANIILDGISDQEKREKALKEAYDITKIMIEPEEGEEKQHG